MTENGETSQESIKDSTDDTTQDSKDNGVTDVVEQPNAAVIEIHDSLDTKEETQEQPQQDGPSDAPAVSDTLIGLGDNIPAIVAPVVQPIIPVPETPVPEVPTTPAINETMPQEAEPVRVVVTGAGLSDTGKIFIEELNYYVKELTSNKRISNDEGVGLQGVLFRVMKGTITASDSDFQEMMTQLLAKIHEYRKTLFSELNIFKYTWGMKTPPHEAEAFRVLTNMFILMADPQGRKLAAKQISWTKALAYRGFTDQQRQRVLNYFYL